MSLLNYFKEITISWKLSLFAMVFCIWPISSYLIFHFDSALFGSLELAKLTLLSSSISSPILVINIAMSFLLLCPQDVDLSLANTSDNLLSGAVLAGITMTLWVLTSGAVVALVNYSLNTAKAIMGTTEIAFLVAIIWSRRIENKRYKRKKKQQEQKPV